MASPTTRTVTPSGIVIEFFDGSEGQRRYLVNGERLPSVTTILGTLDKPALKSWAQKVGVQGAIDLARDGELPMFADAAVSRMKARGLCFWQVSDRAAERGTLAHEDLLKLATGQELLEVSSFTPEQQGFIRGVAAWYADHRPQVVDAETMVASVEHGFAGRYDLRARLVTRDGTGLFDLKTTAELKRDKKGRVKAPYDENLFQLEGYEVAAQECGLGASDYRAVVRVDASGAYDMTVSWAAPEDFLGVLGAYKSVRALSARKKAAAASGTPRPGAVAEAA